MCTHSTTQGANIYREGGTVAAASQAKQNRQLVRLDCRFGLKVCHCTALQHGSAHDRESRDFNADGVASAKLSYYQALMGLTIRQLQIRINV